jgi:hypothetical protein
MFFDNTHTFVAKYVKVEADFLLEVLQPNEDQARFGFLNRFLADDLIDLILSFENSVDEIEQKAFNFLMHTWANQMILDYVAPGEVQINAFGISRTENTDVKTAYAQQIQALKNKLEDNAYLFMGKLITFIIDNVSVFPDYENSPAFFWRNKVFIKSASEFNNIQRLYRSETTYVELFPEILQVQELLIAGRITQTVFNHLLNDPTTGLEQEAATACSRASVYLAIASSIKKGFAKITPQGLMLIEDNKDTGKNLMTSATPDQATTTFHEYNNIGLQYLNQAEKKLIEAGTLTPEVYTRKRFVG